jgi:hypothetical protein
VPVAAGIIGDAHFGAVAALLDMAAERWGAACLNGGHDPTLPVGESSGIVGTVGGTVAAEYVRHLKRGLAEHQFSPAVSPRCSGDPAG